MPLVGFRLALARRHLPLLLPPLRHRQRQLYRRHPSGHPGFLILRLLRRLHPLLGAAGMLQLEAAAEPGVVGVVEAAAGNKTRLQFLAIC